MKSIAPILAACLLILSGCGLNSSKPSSVTEEVRHPSNEMNPPKKVEPEHREPSKSAAKRAPAKPSHRKFEDPRKIPAGITYSEMVRRFGPPSMRLTDSPARTTFSYSKLKTQVQVEVQNGKVVSITAVNTGF